MRLGLRSDELGLGGILEVKPAGSQTLDQA
jgi:hypothetical protein